MKRDHQVCDELLVSLMSDDQVLVGEQQQGKGAVADD